MYWIFFLLPLTLFAAERNLSSDLPMEFDGKNNAVVARQNATFIDDDLVIVADEIRYNKSGEEAIAQGNVRVNFRGTRMVAEKLTYQTATRHFTAQDFRIGFFPYMITGRQADGTMESIKMRDARVYASQTGRFAPNIRVSRMTLMPGDKSARVQLQNAFAGVGPLPLLPIPYANARLDYEEGWDVRLSAGHSSNDGYYLCSESLHPITKNLRAGANLDYYSKRGWLYGPRYSYHTNDTCGWLLSNINSEFSSGFITDGGNRDSDVRNLPIGERRGFVDFRHKQILGNISLKAQTQYWSDSEILRDFRNELYESQQAPESFVEAVYPMDDIYISAFTRFDPNNFEIVPQKLPEIRFDKLSTPIGNTGIYYSAFNSVAHIDQSPLNYNRYDGIFSFNRPMAIKPWWQINPVAAARFTYYDNTTPGTVEQKNSAGRLLGEFGFDSQWSFYGIYDVKNDLWDIDGLKHTLQPVVQYRYLPAATSDNGQIPVIEGRVFDTNLRPTDFFYMADVDNLHSLNLVRFGLKQSLQTRNTAAGAFPSRDLLTLDLYQDYNFTATTDYSHVDSFYILAEANPNEWMSLGSFMRLSWDEMTWREHRLYTTLKDGDYRTLTFSTRFLQNDTNQYTALYTQKLTDRLTAFADLTFDARLHSFTEESVGVWHRLRSGWQTAYGFERRTNDARNSDSRFTFRVHWLNF